MSSALGHRVCAHMRWLCPLCDIPVQSLLSRSMGRCQRDQGPQPQHSYLVIDCHLGVGITLVESFHLTEQVGVWQIHHPELHRAGVGQGSKLELSGGSTNSTTSKTCSHLGQNQSNTQTFTELLFSPSPNQSFVCLNCHYQQPPPGKPGGRREFLSTPTPSSRKKSDLDYSFHTISN